MLWDVLTVNTMYLSNHTLRKLGIWLFLLKYRAGCHVGYGLGCLVGLDNRAKEEREGVGNGDQAQHMTQHRKLPNVPYFMNMSQ
jgi:hypothetical protein